MVSRSDACPCGSGKKYKRCCGARDGRAAAPVARPGPPISGFALAHQMFMQRRFGEAEHLCEQALAAEPGHVEGWFLYAAAALEQQHFEPALSAMQRLAAIAPRRPEVHFNIGHIRERQGDSAAAIAAYREAVRLAPDYGQAWNGLANCLRAGGALAASIAGYREAARIAPNAAPAWSNLGVALKAAGQFDEAMASFKRALECDARYAPAHNNLGNLYGASGDHVAAEASLRAALRLDAGFADARLNLAGILRQTGRFGEALTEFRQALRLQPESEVAWAAFADGLQGFRCNADDAQLRSDLVRALARPAVDPLSLVPVAASLLKHTPGLAAIIAATADQEEIAPARLDACFADPLLGALLEVAVIADWELEAALCSVRRSLLRAASEGTALNPSARAFCVRLALQCLLTEYVYPETPEEAAQAQALAQRIESRPAGTAANAADLAIYACYRPLSGLRNQEGIAGDDPALVRLLYAHLGAPLEEARLRERLKHPGEISDEVSRAVRTQYEEHPYPRWEKVGMRGVQPLAQVVRAVAPQMQVPPAVNLEAPQVLVAGCGTGRHPIQTATRIAGARVLAVDLSGASLGYAMRKAQALQVDNLEFMQADILQLGSVGREFDLIESFGVLHHMRDPLAGWKVLTGLLKPGGLMLIGLYSERARVPVAACREFVREHGYANTTAAIRQFRQDLVRAGTPEVVAAIKNSPDFYSASNCRDLIFHVQEHRYTLPQIDAMGKGLGLRCLGMDLDDRALYAGLPGEEIQLPALDDLAGWDRFEQAHPQAFGSTYKIWWQKA
ncbi:MAG TPA: tetratricopeptide repeat protein [Burkholderiales bacterium]|jgi:tetratricopeptide (TPR) repeat protein/SAM-dependent methyltransferase|nr:tetratricopeptide repeat protein [Burkholderiales bacterium]